MFKAWLFKKYIKPINVEYRTAEHKAAAKAAGEDTMAVFGWYSTLRAASENITQDAYIKSLPAHEIMAYVMYNRMNAQISYKTDLAFQKMQKQKK